MNQMLINNRYLVGSAIGQGGMGAVYKGQDTQLGKSAGGDQGNVSTAVDGPTNWRGGQGI
jgi:serine/threonine protein kinase